MPPKTTRNTARLLLGGMIDGAPYPSDSQTDPNLGPSGEAMSDSQPATGPTNRPTPSASLVLGQNRVITQNMNMVLPMPPMQPARTMNTTGLFERFQHLCLPTFTGTHRPEEAEYWSDHISKMSRPLHCTEAEQVKMVTYMFEKEASLWWDIVLRIVPTGHVWACDAFETHFHEKYFPFTYRNEKEGEFLHLRQGGMTVAEYENHFVELARYAPLILVNELMRMWRFSEGLRPDIRTKMCCASIPNYTELVSMSLQAEQDGERLSRTRMSMGPRPKLEFLSRPFLGKRSRVNSPPRLMAPPTQ
ncbi:uncharacterized protein LOC131219981 [Magnolia sinica]|uniref:uncharacterized protein LOC131219981 n=1 Tax=Magnolia sinica TaxID=86752 RepID=UPI00265A64A2|nr:uncharacterized protein LOC131219981 [Magnolia sinica]